MFTKYLGKFGKAEAEWVREVLDMHDGDEVKAIDAVADAIEIVLLRGEFYDQSQFSEFESSVLAAAFASPHWWRIGSEYLQKMTITLMQDVG